MIRLDAPASPISAPAFRAALGMFATGVTVVTARAPDGTPVGLTVNSFNSVSMAPPLVLWSLSARSASMPVFRGGTHYAVNVLSADQQELALRFAAVMVDRWHGVAWAPGVTGAPLIEGALAHFECLTKSAYDEGDHTIFVGQVVHCSHQPGAAPLLFHGGRFYSEHPL
ncbi:flavin reductase family protein [Ottowia sp. SB7-C50]|jgi:flavin reductase (DIM6/NTAB) family NADH-FMN oxidoreductase RutF|uniref:flavin reductase family protein n=1 Tax=Ottowia sp. SB7-C50 TaxID=3081231 RepID=UPI002954CDA2|nr:flavin reductase family protein [Ottowia sp. SB7-C50]WOP15428.1 flavin reductase family protein [Ottowia sp. SB7-C50]